MWTNCLIRIVFLIKFINVKLSNLLFDCLRLFWNSNKFLPTLEEAEAYLNSLSPDPHNSSIYHNQLCKEQGLDLQIIVPIYNVENYVVKCVDSILNQQTHYKFRVILVNDGSTDRSLQLIETYKNDSRVSIVCQENKGFSGARNSGLEKISANYVAFVDSDDELAPGAIEHLMEAAYRDDADIVQGSFYTRKVSGKQKGSIRFENAVSSVLPKAYVGYMWGKVYRAELFANIHFPEKYWYEDTVNAFILFLKASRFSVIDEFVYYYLVNKSGISSSSRGKSKSVDTFYVTRSLIEDAQQLGILRKLDCQRFSRQIKINYSRTYSLGEKVRKSIFVLTIALYKIWRLEKNDIEVVGRKDSLLFEALERGDFKLYEKYCICS